MSDNDTPSDLFMLATRHNESSKYEARSVNMAFEKRHVPMFAIVPPTAGSFIELECTFKIDAVKYGTNGKIVLYCTSHF